MQVIVHVEDHGGRGDGYYTKPDLQSALDIFFGLRSEPVYADQDAENPLDLATAIDVFAEENEVVFYNDDGERVRIVRDWSNPPPTS